MSYRVYRKDPLTDSAEPVNDQTYESKEEAEFAMRKAKNEASKKSKEFPLPSDAFGPGQTTIPVKGIDNEGNNKEEKDLEFFIRKI